MKRLLLVAALALLPTALFAQAAAADRDVLLTSDGSLFTIESVSSSDFNRSLHLTVQQANHLSETDVPESISTGINWRPALAYDDQSKTLFVFWLRMPNSFSSELLLASYQNGKWQPATSIDNQQYNLRYNLRIGITRHVSTLQYDGRYADMPALLVHAVWWEQTGTTDHARYALMTVDKGAVSSFEIHDLNEFASQPEKAFDLGADFNTEILKHPAIIEGTNSVDVVFGDLTTNALNRVTLKPVADTRIHIPIGHHGGSPFAPPTAYSANWNDRISLIAGSGNGRMAFFTATKDGIRYAVFANGAWSDVKTIATTNNMSVDGAVNALTRMIVISGE
jgi:hypothetical protein